MHKNVACEWWLYFHEVALSGTQPPFTDALIKEVSLGAIWRWIQSSHSYAHQYCLCMRCHSQWIPKAKHILLTLDVCLPITTEGFLLRRLFFTDTEIWCDFHFFFSWVCMNVYFVQVGGSRLQRATEHSEKKRAQAKAWWITILKVQGKGEHARLWIDAGNSCSNRSFMCHQFEQY